MLLDHLIRSVQERGRDRQAECLGSLQVAHELILTVSLPRLPTLVDSRPEVLAMRVLLSVVCLLAVATSASGESAWVLWSQEVVATEPELVTKDKTAWRRIAAFESKSACFADASTRAEELAGMLRASDRIVKERKIEVQRLGLGEDHLAVKSTFNAGLYDEARLWTLYRCFPDTVEPRGQKKK